MREGVEIAQMMISTEVPDYALPHDCAHNSGHMCVACATAHAVDIQESALESGVAQGKQLGAEEAAKIVDGFVGKSYATPSIIAKRIRDSAKSR